MDDEGYIKKKDALDWLFGARRSLMDAAVSPEREIVRKSTLEAVNTMIRVMKAMPGFEIGGAVPIQKDESDGSVISKSNLLCHA